jgi:hypothetical protein
MAPTQLAPLRPAPTFDTLASDATRAILRSMRRDGNGHKNLVRGAVVVTILAAAAIGGAAVIWADGCKDPCEKAQLTIPPGTSDRSQVASFAGRRPQSIAWTPGYCVMTVQVYQRERLVQEWKNREPGALNLSAATAGETEIKIWKEGSKVPADFRWIWLSEPESPAQAELDSAGSRSSESSAKGGGGDPCAGRPRTYQAFEGVCLPDRLVAYLKCVEKTGGNRLVVERDETSKGNSGFVVRLGGTLRKFVVEGVGEAEAVRNTVNESIIGLHEIYGSNSTKLCLRIALGNSGSTGVPPGGKPPGPIASPDTRPSPDPPSGSPEDAHAIACRISFVLGQDEKNLTPAMRTFLESNAYENVVLGDTRLKDAIGEAFRRARTAMAAMRNGQSLDVALNVPLGHLAVVRACLQARFEECVAFHSKTVEQLTFGERLEAIRKLTTCGERKWKQSPSQTRL